MPYTGVAGIGCGGMNMVHQAFKISRSRTIHRICGISYKDQQAIGTGVQVMLQFAPRLTPITEKKAP
ncbi:MAG TPA: hypothetical protein DGF36_01635 [Alteromonas sp.]|nr:hypothetical protein [Alteromonas sp.]HCA77953.1 hypothetical protein [Alteromonas sp.]HCV16811.1 hypothetical protein [Alteromonas sp.]